MNIVTQGISKHFNIGRAVLAGLSFSISLTANAQDLADIKERGVLRHLGTPYANFVTGNGHGFDVDIIRLFAQHLGVQYEFVASDWQNMISDLTGQPPGAHGSGKATGQHPVRGDVAASGITVLPSRKELIDFSVPIFPTAVWLAARSTAKVQPIQPSGDLAKDIKATKARMHQGQTLVSDVGCLNPGLYGLSGKDYKLIDIKAFPDMSLNDMLPAMLRGLTEMSMVDVPDMMVGMEKWPGQIKVIGPISEEQDTAAGFRKSSPALREAFNRFFAGLQQDGTYMKLVNKYYRPAPRYFPIYFGALKGQ